MFGRGKQKILCTFAPAMSQNKSIEAFFFLLRAGLFGDSSQFTVHSSQLGDVDWMEVYQLAKEQSVVGLVAEGMEMLQGEWLRTHGVGLVPRQCFLRFISYTMRLEKRNLAMNMFIAKLMERLHKKGMNALLIKGQGVAQCYMKPLLRACGDVDLLLNNKDYQAVKDFLLPFASSSEREIKHRQHIGLIIGGWQVELHGSLRCGYSFRIDKELDKVCKETFFGGDMRYWTNGDVQIPLLGCENDVIYVFVHFMNHFYKEGVGIRQICDWCRLLWSLRECLDLAKLESRLKNMRVMSEWRAFGMYAVEYLGMPEEAMPLYADDEKWRRKARRIHLFIMKTGNMGQNRGKNKKTDSLLLKKMKSTRRRCIDLANHLMIFPLDTLRFFPSILLNGFRHR